jgi:two-component system nitrate/nitrite response regulator NarL
MDSSSMLETNSRLNSSVQDCRVFPTTDPQLARTDLSETLTTSEDGYRLSGSLASVCRTVLLGENGLFRAGLKQMLQMSRVSVIGEGHDIASLLDTMKIQPIPELAICHIASGRNENAALNFIGGLRLYFTQAKLVVLADTCTRSLFSCFVSADVNAVLLTSISSEILKQSLELVLIDYRLIPAAFVSHVMDAPVRPPLGWMPTEDLAMLSGTTTWNDKDKTQAGLPTALPSHQKMTARISQREHAVLGCLVRGLSNKCIARELNVAEGTVKVYPKLLSRKLKVGNRTQLAVWALHQTAQLDAFNVVGAMQAHAHCASER